MSIFIKVLLMQLINIKNEKRYYYEKIYLYAYRFYVRMYFMRR